MSQPELEKLVIEADTKLHDAIAELTVAGLEKENHETLLRASDAVANAMAIHSRTINNLIFGQGDWLRVGVRLSLN